VEPIHHFCRLRRGGYLLCGRDTGWSGRVYIHGYADHHGYPHAWSPTRAEALMIIFVFAAMLGAIGRYLAHFYLPRHGILVVNMLGSCIAGIILRLTLFLRLNPIIVQPVTGGF